MVGLKYDSNRRIQVAQFLYHAQTVNYVSGKPGYRFCDYVIYLSCSTIVKKSLQPFPVINLGTAYSLIRIDVNKHPTRLGIHIFSKIVLLKLVGRSLLIIIRRYTNIRSNPFGTAIKSRFRGLCRYDSKL